MPEFPEILVVGRNKLGVSQEEFAAMIPMDPKNYTGVENGRKFMTEKQLESVSKLIAYDYDELYRMHEEWEIKQRPEKAQRIMEQASYLPTEKLVEALRLKTNKQEFNRLIKQLKLELE